AHVSLVPAERVEGHPAHPRLLPEGAVTLVDPEVVGFGVVGDENVRPAVPGEVRTADTQSRAGHAAEAGLHRDVRKANGTGCRRLDAAQVVVQLGDGAVKSTRVAVFATAACGSALRRPVIIHVIGDHQV